MPWFSSFKDGDHLYNIHSLDVKIGEVEVVTLDGMASSTSTSLRCVNDGELSGSPLAD